MNLGLQDRVVLVTASSRGLGRAAAVALAREGASVAMCARGEEELRAAAAEVDAAGPGRVLAEPTDVTDPDALAKLTSTTQSRLGAISGCVINVGGPARGAFNDLRPSHFKGAFDLLISSAVRIAKLVLPKMVEADWGRIVQITSVTVRQPIPELALSNILRPSVHALTKTLANEVAASGVTVNSVAPGHHLTARMDEVFSADAEKSGRSRDELIAELAAEIPVGRLGKPEELGALIAFLMSKQAAFITGQCIVADGGWSRGTF